jgi:putative ABC transport system permease protein
MRTLLNPFGLASRVLDDLRADTRFAVRNLRKHALLSVVVVITLGFGLGLNTGIFTLIHASLFRAHVDADPSTFFRVHAFYSDTFTQGRINLQDYEAYRMGSPSVRELAAWDDVWTTLGARDPVTVRVALASCNFFSVYGLTQLELGRFFLPSECVDSGSGVVAIVSDEMWRSQFEADPHIVGKIIHVGHTALTIVGVTPPRFSGRIKGINIWIPSTMLSQFESAPGLTVEGRLNPGYSRATAQAELSVIAERQDRFNPNRKTRLIVTDGSMIAEPHLRMGMWIVASIMGAIGLVSLICCLNVSALLLSRAASRKREIAVRLALGAGRNRLFRMLMTESILLATLGGTLGVFLAWKLPAIIIGIIPVVNPPTYCLKPDWTVFAYVAVITVGAGFVSGAVPILESQRFDLAESLKGKAGLFVSAVRSWRTLDFMIAAQIAASLVLLAAAAICVRAQYTMFAAGPGFETEHVIAVGISATSDDWTLRHTIEERIRSVPGVLSICFAQNPPFEREDLTDVRVAGQPPGSGLMISVNSVSASFFQTLEIPIVRGRSFSDGDAASDRPAPIAVVSEAFARSFWPGEDPVGKVVEAPDRLEVVGISRDLRSARYGELDGPQLFRLQNPKGPSGSLLVRFQGPSAAIESKMTEIIRGAGADEVSRPMTVKAMMDLAASGFVAIAEMIVFLGIAGVGLAVAGVYGVTAFATVKRTKEFGIRMALGAARADILHLVLRSGAKTIGVGLFCGLCLAVGASTGLARLMKSAPFALKTEDPQIYLGVCFLLTSASLIAMLIPAFRALRLNPVHSLREE